MMFVQKEMINEIIGRRVYERMMVDTLAVEAEGGLMTGSTQKDEIAPVSVSVTQYYEAEESGFTVNFD